MIFLIGLDFKGENYLANKNIVRKIFSGIYEYYVSLITQLHLDFSVELVEENANHGVFF